MTHMIIDNPPRKASPASHAVVKKFGRISNTKSFCYLLLDYVVIILAVLIAQYSANLIFIGIALVLIGTRQVALMNLMHSAAHYTLLSPKRLNNKVDLFIAYPLWDSVSVYRARHLAHHRAFARNHADRFAYLHTELGLPSLGFWGRTWVIFLRPLLGYEAYLFVADTVAILAKNRLLACKMAAFWACAGAACYWTGCLRLLCLYLFSVLAELAQLRDRESAMLSAWTNSNVPDVGHFPSV